MLGFDFDVGGYFLAKSLFTAPELKGLESVFSSLGEGALGARNAMSDPAVRRLAQDSSLLDALRSLVSGNARPVKATAFDKTPTANWKVPWHQDVTIAVEEKAEVPGFGPWPIKAGVVHVQATEQVLSDVVLARIHLDDADESNGTLQVLPGTHLLGKLSAAEVGRVSRRCEPITCVVEAGDVLFMRPLVVHRSKRGFAPARRRVLQLEFATRELPAPLQWFW